MAREIHLDPSVGDPAVPKSETRNVGVVRNAAIARNEAESVPKTRNAAIVIETRKDRRAKSEEKDQETRIGAIAIETGTDRHAIIDLIQKMTTANARSERRSAEETETRVAEKRSMLLPALNQVVARMRFLKKHGRGRAMMNDQGSANNTPQILIIAMVIKNNSLAGMIDTQGQMIRAGIETQAATEVMISKEMKGMIDHNIYHPIMDNIHMILVLMTTIMVLAAHLSGSNETIVIWDQNQDDMIEALEDVNSARE